MCNPPHWDVIETPPLTVAACSCHPSSSNSLDFSFSRATVKPNHLISIQQIISFALLMIILIQTASLGQFVSGQQLRMVSVMVKSYLRSHQPQISPLSVIPEQNSIFKAYNLIRGSNENQITSMSEFRKLSKRAYNNPMMFPLLKHLAHGEKYPSCLCYSSIIHSKQQK